MSFPNDTKKGFPATPPQEDASAAGPSEPPPPFTDHAELVPSTPEESPDLPPGYNDSIQPISQNAPLITPFSRPLAQQLKWFNNLCVQDPQLDEDPIFLERWIRHIGKQPVILKLQVRGTHMERVRHGSMRSMSGSGTGSGSQHESVVDFDFFVDLSGFLFTNVQTGESFVDLRTAEEEEKTHRGTVFRHRGDTYSRHARRAWRDRDTSGALDEESSRLTSQPLALGTDGLEGAGRGVREEFKPSLAEWCHRYCAASSLRSFEVTRKVRGLDEELIKTEVTRAVRSTGYMGSLSVSFVLENPSITIFSSSRINQWRMNKWIRWFIILTLLVIFVWPYLFFATRKWNVIFIDWWFSRIDPATGQKQYASLSETEILDFWTEGVKDAAVTGRTGTLAVSDAVRARNRRGECAGGVDMDAGIGGRMALAVAAAGGMQVTTGWGGDY